MTDAAALYACSVVHCRRVAPRTRFRYRLFYLLLDIDRLDELARGLRRFSHNRFNLLSLHDRDYGSRAPGALRTWAERVLRGAGIELDGGRIRLLCLPRILGYAFNPLALWYCEHGDGSLRAVIAEVRNTFGERHSYLLDADGPIGWNAPIAKDKCFHVSPFLDLAGRYRFRLEPPGEVLRVAIHETQEGVPVLDASLVGRRHELSDTALLTHLLRMPWATLKVTLGIHWEALRLWLRGASVRHKPAPPELEVS